VTLRVLQCIGFHQSEEIHVSKRQYFIRSKNFVLNFAAVRYFLHKCSETKLCKNIIHRLGLCVICFPAHRSSWKQKKLAIE